MSLSGGSSERPVHPCAPLVAVAFLYAAAQLIAVTTRMRLGWDETVYVSQVSPHVPTAFFSAPRARGVTLLAAPLVAVTSSVAALRVYMTALSTVGLVIAYWPWTRLLRPVTVALAAFLLAALWMVQFYGNEVMPNIYVAYGAVAATAWFAHTVRGQSRTAPVWLAASLAFVALMRPGDAVWLVLPLLVAVAFVRRRRLVALAAILVWTAGGRGPVDRGGVHQVRRPAPPAPRGERDRGRPRLASRGRADGAARAQPQPPVPAVRRRDLARPASFRLVAAGPRAGGLRPRARGAGRRLGLLALPAACGAVLGASYLLLLGYAAPRFLIPAYALLALPMAELGWGAATFGRGRWRIVTAGVVALGLATQTAGQQLVLAHMVTSQYTARGDFIAITDQLQYLGVRPPCTLSGEQAPPLAFYSGCRSLQIAGNDTSTDVAGLRGAATLTRLAVVEHTGPRPRYTRGWLRYSFTTPNGRRGASSCRRTRRPPRAPEPPAPGSSAGVEELAQHLRCRARARSRSARARPRGPAPVPGRRA